MFLQSRAKIIALATALAALGLENGSKVVASEPATIQLVDLTDDFDRFWNDTTDLSDTDRTRALEERFRDIIPDFYDAARLAEFGTSPEKYAGRLREKSRNIRSSAARLFEVL